MILSAGVVIVRREAGEWKFLGLRAYRQWDFPKGELEPGEDPLQAARREVLEETGISQLEFKWGDEFKETAPYRDGKKIARYYLAETHQFQVTFAVNPELGRPEHDEYKWLSFAEAKRLAPDRLQPVIDWAHSRLEKE